MSQLHSTDKGRNFILLDNWTHCQGQDGITSRRLGQSNLLTQVSRLPQYNTKSKSDVGVWTGAVTVPQQTINQGPISSFQI